MKVLFEMFLVTFMNCFLKISSTKNDQRDVKNQLLLALTLATTLGLVWLLGYFMLLCRNQSCLTVMSWIFTVAIILQVQKDLFCF